MSNPAPPLRFQKIDLYGEQVADFLHNQTTVHTENLPIDTAQIGAFCNRQGRVITSCIIQRTSQQEWTLIMREGMIDVWLKEQKLWLKMARIETQPKQSTNEYISWGTIASADPAPVPEQSANSLASNNNEEQNIQAVCAENNIIIRHQGVQIQFNLAVISGKQAQPEANNSNAAVMFKHFPHWTKPETALMFTPAQLRYPQAGLIDFEKGCYLGQEIIARMHYKGRVKKNALPLTLNLLSDDQWTDVSGTYQYDSKALSILDSQGNTYPILDAVIAEKEMSCIVMLDNQI